MSRDVFLLAMLAWLTGFCLFFSAIVCAQCFPQMYLTVALSVSVCVFLSPGRRSFWGLLSKSACIQPLFPPPSSPAVNRPLSLSPVSLFNPLLAPLQSLLLPVQWCGMYVGISSIHGKHCISKSRPGLLHPYCCTPSPMTWKTGTTDRKVGKRRCSAVGNHEGVLFVSVRESQWI